jgi:cytochrome P450
MVKEAMRLDPPAYALGRLSLTDHEVGGYLIPAGSFVAVSQFATHRHPHIWEDPEAFDPGITLRPDVAVPIQPARR